MAFLVMLVFAETTEIQCARTRRRNLAFWRSNANFHHSATSETYSATVVLIIGDETSSNELKSSH